jgi:Xaa-Pro aminopeptidase
MALSTVLADPEAATGTHDGDAALAVLLRRAGLAVTVAEVRDLAAGAAAAPDGFDGDAWIALVAPAADDDLRRRLRALGAEARRRRPDPAAGDHGRRLEALRRSLKRHRLSGFIVPRADEHQGEQVAACSERLAWLTGFTGSAGLAVVLSDGAALFVDGRYTTQAAHQVDTGRWEIRHLTDDPPADWLATRLPAQARLGFDPWLHTPSQVATLEAACRRARARLVAVDANPVDPLWHDRPPPPIAPVVRHDDALAGHSAAEKRGAVAEDLAGHGQDAAVLSAPDSIAWLLNVRGGDIPYSPVALAFAIVHRDGTVAVFTDPRKLTPEVRRHLGPDVRFQPPDDLGPALEALGAARKVVRIDADGTPAWIADRLRRAGAIVTAAQDPCALPRAVKNAVELEGMRSAHRRDGAALCRFLAWLDRTATVAPVTEMGAAAKLDGLRAEDPLFRGPSFPTISAAGEHAAIVHYRATAASDRALGPDGLYLVDSGGQYLDGTTDVTRTVAIGGIEPEMRSRFTLVLKGHIALATARFPKGTTGSQLDLLARQSLWQHGLDYDHGTGHGVGAYLGVHEGPQRISKLPNRVALEAGMVLSNEPGYYKPGAYGIRIENLVTVAAVPTPEGGERPMLGFRTLTLAPIDRTLIDPTLLSPAEFTWLDAYHARVAAALSPLVDAETRAWLAAATRPLPG